MKLSKVEIEGLVETVILDMAKVAFEQRLYEDKKAKSISSKIISESRNPKYTKLPISEIHGVYAYLDSSNTKILEFFKQFKHNLGYTSEGFEGGADQATILSGDNRTAGSGSWEYSFKDSRIYVEGFSNGIGFLGTNYVITEITSTADVAGYDSPSFIRKRLRRKLQAKK